MSNARSFCRRSARRTGVAVSAAALLAGSVAVGSSTPVSAADGSQPQEPTLTGRLAEDPSGLSGKTVDVFARGDDGSTVRAAKATTNRVGRFNAALNAGALRKKADADGFVQLITIAQTEPGSAPPIPQYSTVKINRDGSVSDPSGAEPSVTVDNSGLEASDTQTAGTTLGSSASPVCYTNTVKHSTTAGPDTAATIGQMQIVSDGTLWAAGFEYRNTRTTTMQTGSAITAGVPAFSFKVNGSVTRTSSASSSASTSIAGQAGSATNRKVVITVGQAIDHYRCWQSPTPAPANPGYWPEISVTVIPGTWKRDFYTNNLDSAALTPCAPGNFVLGPASVFRRTTGQSWKQEKSFSVNVASVGGTGTFTGDSTVTQTSESSKDVNQFWWNTSTTNTKYLCGQNTPNLASATNVGLVVAKV